MSAEPILDVEATDLEPARDLVTRPTLAVTPNVQASELVARLDVIRTAMETAMQEGIDYGRIPGVDKPCLFKPGAEKLGVLFQLDIQPDTTKTWGPGEHLTVECTAMVFHAPTGTRLGKGEGLATTREKKHAKRKQERVCPSCKMPAVIPGKAEYGGGWLCWKKKDGCGAKFSAGDPSIEEQDVGTIENPELPDAWNNVVKMAEKRARVDAVLAVTGASALFTQDVEDSAPDAPPQDHGPFVEASPDLKRLVRDVLSFLLDGNEQHVSEAANALSTQFEARLPASAGQALVILGSAVKRHREGVVRDAPSDVPGAGEDDFKHEAADEADQRVTEVGPS